VIKLAIGIAAYGPYAGKAVFTALKKIELIPSGVFIPSHVWGFTVFKVMLDNGQIISYETQRGGTTTLITEAEATGVEPPKEVANAKFAAIISAGPDRPKPLDQYLPSIENIGMVTGHRMPHAITKNGIPLNIEILDKMKTGLNASKAVTKLLNENPEIDAGVIAIDKNGNVSSGNSDRVNRRNDYGTAIRENKEVSASVHVILNAIHPPQGLADVASDIAMAIMTQDNRQPKKEIIINAGLKVEFGENDEVIVNNNLEAIKIITKDSTVLKGKSICDVPYLGSKVYQKTNEKETNLGQTTDETLVILEDGIIKELSGKNTIKLGII